MHLSCFEWWCEILLLNNILNCINRVCQLISHFCRLTVATILYSIVVFCMAVFRASTAFGGNNRHGEREREREREREWVESIESE
jgi:hypothetical protein